MTISIPDEYAELMKPINKGHFLYTPQRFSDLHPGAVGFFDKQGGWNLITDLSVAGRPEKDGFKAPSQVVNYEKPTESIWRSTSSSSEAESSFGLKAGVSAAAAAAPIDVSAEAKNKWGQTGNAALITDDSVVVNEWLKVPCRDVITKWVEQNAKDLVKGDWGSYIKDYGLWAIKKTWSTQECAIKMTSAHNRDTSGGVDLSGTGIGKVGASGSNMSKSTNEGWRTYKATEEEKALVVSYGGAAFRLHKIQMFHSKNPLKQTERAATDAQEIYKPIFDENGNQIGGEYFRPVYDENGKQVGEEKIDKEAEEKARQEEQKKFEEENPNAEDDFYVESGDVIGEDDEEEELEKEAARAQAEEEAQKRGEFSAKAREIYADQSLDEEQKKQAIKDLFKVDTTLTTTTLMPTTTVTTTLN
ncbi:hypothetical protein N7454_004925 [Penicillium verhagenii]|nr:hypothetical protein N7454_004925 [Penicillium verhagenii]